MPRPQFGTLVLAFASLGLAACSSTAEPDGGDTEGALEQRSGDEPVSRDRVPDVHAFKGWKDDTQTVKPPKPSDVTRIQVDCADKRLFPTHPQSSLKQYHRYATGSYDHFKLSGDSQACKISSPPNNRGEKRCAAPDILDYAMLSDTYADSCGHFYRGFWDELYFRREETMGTLMSKGRAVYPVPNAQFKGEVFDGQTYAVAENDFAFIAALFPGDANRIESAKKNALQQNTHRYNETTRIFEYVGPYR